MKKVLALILVAVLAIGMGATAFASSAPNVAKITRFVDGKGLIDGYTAKSADVVRGKQVNVGTVYAQDKREDVVNLYAELFNGPLGSSVTSTVYNYTNGVYYYLDAYAFANWSEIFADGYAVGTPANWDTYEQYLIKAIQTAAYGTYNRKALTYDAAFDGTDAKWGTSTFAMGDTVTAADTRYTLTTQTLINNWLARTGETAPSAAADDDKGGSVYTNGAKYDIQHPTFLGRLDPAANNEYNGTTSTANTRRVWTAINGIEYNTKYMTDAGARAELVSRDLILPARPTQADYDRVFKRLFDAGILKQVTHTNKPAPLYFMNVDGSFKKGTYVSGMPTDDEYEEFSLRNISNEEIRENNITVYTQVQEESKAIKEVNFLRNSGAIEVIYTTRYVSVDKKDFLLTVALAFNGRRDDVNTITFVGSIYNRELKVYANTNTADISTGLILIPMEFNKAIALNVGNGATIHTKLYKDKKQYCTTSRDPDEEDYVVFRQYPDVDNVLTFYNVGINATGDKVTLSTDYEGYYVYDADMNYAGRGNEQLDFSQKFYLANKRLDLETEDEELEEPDDYETPSEVAPNPPTGGDNGVSNNNVNSNPGTGR